MIKNKTLKINTIAKVTTAILLTFVLVQCKEKPEQKKDMISGKDGCSYSYNHETTELKWTAFKFTEKVGVGGTFDKVTVTNAKESSSPAEVVENIEFSIDTTSVNSANEDRDKKISNSYFGTLEGGQSITGKVKAFDRTTSGKATVGLNINGVSKDIEFDYKYMNTHEYELWGSVNIEDFEGIKAVESLNKVCHDLHIGKDGISKLWPDVEIRVFTRLTEKCE